MQDPERTEGPQRAGASNVLGRLLEATPLFVALAFYVILLSSGLRDAYELDPDEGNNVIKALLLDRGFALYQDIWSDQPPLHTNLLGLCFRVFGLHVEVGRALTAAFSACVVLVVYDLVRREIGGLEGHLAGLGSALQLAFGASYVRHSMSVMIGIPAIALAALSFWVLAVGQRRRRATWIASGVLFGLSLSMKLFTAPLAPVLAGLAARSARDRTSEGGPSRALSALGFWGAGLLIALILGLAPALSGEGLAQLVTAHWLAGQRMQGHTVWEFLRWDALLYLTALGGALWAIQQKSRVGIALAGWLLLGIGALAAHAPVWLHHAVLIEVPACALAAMALGGAVRALRASDTPWFTRRTIPAILISIFWLSALGIRARHVRRTYLYRDAPGEDLAELAVRRYAPDARLMVTSRQMIAFRMGMSVPPDLAVTSSKRFEAGLLSAEQIVSAIDSLSPAAVVLDERWSEPVVDQIRQAIDGRYRVVLDDPEHRRTLVYVRRVPEGAPHSGGAP